MNYKKNGGPRRTRTAAADRLRPADYEEDAQSKRTPVSRRKVTSCLSGAEHHCCNRAYAEPEVGWSEGLMDVS